MQSVVNEVSSFEIRELSGDRRAIVLTGRALPYRPFTLKTSQRIDVTWYPGYADATATVLGASEDPSTVNGMWKDKYLSVEQNAVNSTGAILNYPIMLDGTPVFDVRAAIALFDDIVRKGQLLEVTWDEQARRGHADSFEKTFFNVHDVQWNLSFVWTSRAEQARPTVVTNEIGMSDIANVLKEQTDALLEEAEPPFAPNADFLADLDSALLAVSTVTDSTSATVVALARGALTPVDAARRMLAAAAGITDQAEATLRILSGIPAREMRDLSGAAASFGDRILAFTYANRTRRATLRLRRTATFQRAALKARTDQGTRAVHTAAEGEDLRDVSRVYYGTPDQWKSILVFNSLTSSRLHAGQTIFIPNPTSAGLPMGC